MTAKELADWLAFDRIHPIGSQGDNIRSAAFSWCAASIIVKKPPSIETYLKIYGAI